MSSQYLSARGMTPPPCWRWWLWVLAFAGTTRANLLRRRGERRQLVDVAGVVLDDDGGLGVGRELFHAVDRGDRLCPVEIEPRHAAGVVILVEMHGVAGDQHRPGLR